MPLPQPTPRRPRFRTPGGGWALLRAADRDLALVGPGHAAALDLPARSTAGRNTDDGDLNFAKGDPVATVLKGFLDADLKGERLGAFTPSLTFGQDVRGWSADGVFSQGRQSLLLRRQGRFPRGVTADFSDLGFQGGDFSNTRDRDVVSLSLGIRP